MTKTLIALALATTLLGCSAVKEILAPILPAGVADRAEVIAINICNVLPTGESLVNMFAANPLLNTAELLADAFCAAIRTPVTKLGAARRGAIMTGTYRGQPISGTVK